jgi:hypothetical protein
VFERSTEIEHYNNYSSNGINLNSTRTSCKGAKSAVPELTNATDNNLFCDEQYSLFVKPETEVFVSNTEHEQPVWIIYTSHTEIRRINDYMNQSIQDFMAGKVGADKIMDIIENAYRDLLAYNISLGNTDGTDLVYNARLLSNTQAQFLNRALSENMIANNNDGFAYAHAKHGLPSNAGFAYYNAKYFHLNKELQAIGMNAVEKIAKSEGFDFFDAQGLIRERGIYCFNRSWHEINSSVSVSIKDTGIEPPEDFIMFFTPRHFSGEEQHNFGVTQKIIYSDASRPEGENAAVFYIKTPKGMSPFRQLPLWVTQGSYINEDGVNIITWDITKYLNLKNGDDLLTRLKEFFSEYVNVYHGSLSVWSNGAKSEHEIPFDFFTNDKRFIHGSDLTDAMSHNDFISNFRFYMY